MTDTLNQTQLAQIVSAVISALQVQGAAPKGAAPQANGGNTLEHKDRHLVNSFTRRGFKDVVLMDRNDPTKAFNVKPFKAWVKEGRIVRKGERGVRGLFHITQTDLIAPAKQALKAKGKPVAAKSQLPLV
jgi:hypothetical protein